MDAVRKQRHSGALSVVASLALVCAFWLVAPRTKQYKAYKDRWELQAGLRAITTPAGTHVIDSRTMYMGDSWIAGRIYSTDSQLDRVKSHYMQEFPRHGFVFKEEATSKESETSLRFCARAYEASLVFGKPADRPLTYAIFLRRRDTAC
jgi:hypothetical protein